MTLLRVMMARSGYWVAAGILLAVLLTWSALADAQVRLTPAQVRAAFPSVILANLNTPQAAVRLANLTPYEAWRLRTLFAQENGGDGAPLLGVVMRHTNAVTLARFLARPAVLPVRRATGPTPDFTIEEIYLEFRTGAQGLSVLSSMEATLEYVATRLSVGFGAGYTLGTLVADALEAYSPETLDAIGGTIDAGRAMVTGSPAQDVPVVIQVDPFQALQGMGSGGSGRFQSGGAMDEDEEADPK